jgi:hypothetical protein
MIRFMIDTPISSGEDRHLWRGILVNMEGSGLIISNGGPGGTEMSSEGRTLSYERGLSQAEAEGGESPGSWSSNVFCLL